ncbi:hypothetical protein FACS1894132_11010 [Clostridia bacterium]|nr:hypothetical protein FACS1894132_11010 [Clostridia bacterium]
MCRKVLLLTIINSPTRPRSYLTVQLNYDAKNRQVLPAAKNRQALPVRNITDTCYVQAGVACAKYHGHMLYVQEGFTLNYY